MELGKDTGYTSIVYGPLDVSFMKKKKKKVKQSHYRPGQAQRVHEVKAPRFRDNGTGWWWVVSLTLRPPVPPGNTPGTHFC